MEIFNFAQRSEEWYNIRLGVLSASDAATIAANGSGLETLCLKKALELVTHKRQDEYSNEDIERGIELEEEARSLYQIQRNIEVKTVGFIKIDALIGCSPDGLVREEGLVEFKCRNNLNHFKRILGYPIDREHQAQMQMQLLVTDRKWVDYVCYNRNFELEKQLVVERVHRNDKIIEAISKGLERGTYLINKHLVQYRGKANETIKKTNDCSREIHV